MAAELQPTRCSGWNPPRFDILRILRTDRPDDCPFQRIVVEPLVEAVLRRAGPRFDSDAILSDIAVKVLHRYAEHPDKAPTETPHLVRFISNVVRDARRKASGRRRCSACGHYRKDPAAAGGHCQRQTGADGQPHPHFGQRLEPRAEPHRLDPRCRGFLGRTAQELPADDAFGPPGGSAPVRNEDMRIDRLRSAMARLTAEHPLRGLLVAQSKLDGYTYEELAERHAQSRDQVKRHIQAGLERLKELLAENKA